MVEDGEREGTEDGEGKEETEAVKQPRTMIWQEV